MKVFYNSYPEKRPTAVALGNFDGVHAGHTRLINTLTSFALPTVVYTFEEHPINRIVGKGTVLTVNTNSEKAQILESMGVDSIVFADFDAVRNMSPDVFAEEILMNLLSAKEVVCGYNYRFGKNGEGDPSMLSRLLEERGGHLTVIEEVTVDNLTVSSTEVREALMAGDMEKAERLLGRPYFINSTVVHGKAIGRQMGFPTINETFADGRLVLPYGVYFARCVVKGGESHIAVVNVGTRPTVNSTDPTPTVEAHIIDFEGDLYGKDVRVEFIKKHRDERKFENLDRLREQISSDIIECKRFFEER